MINNQQRMIVNAGEPHSHHQPVSAKPSVVSVSSIDSDVSDRRDVREALYSGIFKRHRKTILVLGSFLKMLRAIIKGMVGGWTKSQEIVYERYLDRMHALNRVFVFVAS